MNLCPPTPCEKRFKTSKFFVKFCAAASFSSPSLLFLYDQLPIVAREIRIPHGRLFKLDLFHFLSVITVEKFSVQSIFLFASLTRNVSTVYVCTNILCTLSKPGARFLPFALCAPHLPMLHPVHLPALLGVSPGSSEGRLGAGAVGLG